MPKTKFQSIIFTLIVVSLMTYFMLVYTLAVNSSTGLINSTFLVALKKFPTEVLIVFILAYFLAGPISRKFAFKVVNPEKDSKIFVILSIQTFTVLFMVGLMSIYALFAQHLISSNVISNYIIIYCKNFIMAYPLQIFFIGPIARRMFNVIFS